MILNLKWQQWMFLVVRKFFYEVIGILLLLDFWLITDEEQKTKVIYIVYINMYVEVHQLTYGLGQPCLGHSASHVRVYNGFFLVFDSDFIVCFPFCSLFWIPKFKKHPRGNACIAKQQYTVVKDGDICFLNWKNCRLGS